MCLVILVEWLWESQKRKEEKKEMPFEKKRQIVAGVVATLVVLIATILPAAFVGAPGYLNATFADPDAKYVEDSNFDMDGNSALVSGKSFVYWYNSSGYLNKNNISLASGVESIDTNSTAGNNMTTIDWNEGTPYHKLTFAFTAKDALDDGVAKIQLKVSGFLSNKAHTITLSVGGVTLYTTTISKTDTTRTINKTVWVSPYQLMQAVVNEGVDESYFVLTVTGQNDTALTLSGSAMYVYNCTNPVSMDTALTLGGAVTMLYLFIAAMYAQPRYALPSLTRGPIGKRRVR